MTKLRNPIQKFLEAKGQKQILDKAKERFEYKPFYMEYRGLHNMAKYGRLVFNSFSIATGLTFLALLIDSGLGLLYAALALAVLLLSFWELGKTSILEKAFTAFYRNEKAPLALSALGLLFLGASVYCSIEGAKSFYQANSKAGQELEALHQQQTDSIRQGYGLKIEAIAQSIKDIEANKPTRWGGLLSGSENRQILNYQGQIERLESKREAELQALADTQQKEAQALAENTSFNTWGFAALAGVNEALILLIAWFLVYYDYRTAQESEAITTPPISFDVPTIQKLLHMVAIDSGTEQLLLNSHGARGQSSIGFHSQRPASAAAGNRQKTGEEGESGSASAANGLMADIGNGVRDFRYLMRKHRVNVLTVKEAIDLYESSSTNQ